MRREEVRPGSLAVVDRSPARVLDAEVRDPLLDGFGRRGRGVDLLEGGGERERIDARSEEHTSELQSPYDLVCRLLLEKKNKKYYEHETTSGIMTDMLRVASCRGVP